MNEATQNSARKRGISFASGVESARPHIILCGLNIDAGGAIRVKIFSEPNVYREGQ